MKTINCIGTQCYKFTDMSATTRRKKNSRYTEMVLRRCRLLLAVVISVGQSVKSPPQKVFVQKMPNHKPPFKKPFRVNAFLDKILPK